MIDLDEIDAKCNAYLNSVGRSCSTILDVNEIKQLVAYARQAEKDAARYRWLRDEIVQSHGGIALFDGYCHVCDIDLFIEEAMQCDEAMQCK